MEYLDFYLTVTPHLQTALEPHGVLSWLPVDLPGTLYLFVNLFFVRVSVVGCHRVIEVTRGAGAGRAAVRHAT